MDKAEKEPFDPSVDDEGGGAGSDGGSELGDENKERGNWGKQIDFLFSCIGYAVGLGNIWRFPYLCMRNGGGAFLIPYFIFLFIGGVPLFYMELAMGQFSSRSPLAVWDLCPLFKGIGWGMTIISCFFSIYYEAVITWVIYYLGMSFQNPLPWSHCNNTWNTDRCVTRGGKAQLNSTNETELAANIYGTGVISYNFTKDLGNMTSNATAKAMTSVEEFWQYNTLEMTEDIGTMGGLRWQLVLCHIVGWTVVILCVLRGIKTSGKVVYVTATVPYIFLTILLIRGCTLPGAADGVLYYIRPNWSKLGEFQIWTEACMQIFYSLGPAWGGLITMSSYNRFNNNIFRDSMMVPVINSFTSFFAGFVVFSVIGFMANEAGLPVEDVITSGPGLAFVAYPEAISNLPFSPIWSVLFFIMLLTIGLDSQFASFETLVSGIVDEFPHLFRGKKFFVMIGAGIFEMFISLIFCTRAGIYHFQIWDWYSAAFSVVTIAVLECFVVFYLYGGKRFLYDIKMMLGYTPSIIWRILLGGVTPILMFGCLLYAIVKFDSPKYGEYEYPIWAKGMGWALALCSMVPIPTFIIYRLARERGTFIQRLKHSVKPTPAWGPMVEKNRKGYIYDQNYREQELTSMTEKQNHV
ncbi:sodium- and chloride-dependent glycine transporter 1-like [Lineus longissimus]|uniref:sodium- and chloride-dependent glycine transporter 1-like n=1 Tax=Lineus longissimus TaxID=88925 RepID=UPI002B4CA622